MSEHFANINFHDGESIKATRNNTSLYQHFGYGALYDHVWIHREEDETGGYVWAQQPPDNPAYLSLAPMVVESGAELHLNIRKVAESDLKAFGRAAIGDMDQIPNWLPEV